MIPLDFRLGPHLHCFEIHALSLLLHPEAARRCIHVTLTHSCIVPHSYLIRLLGHNYANSRPILLVQSTISFHLVSFE